MVNDNNVKLISFSKILAEQHSVREAVVLQYIAFRLSKDRVYPGIKDAGKRWFYHTENQFLAALPFCKNIKVIVNKLVKKEILLKKHFSKTHNVSYYTFKDQAVLTAATENKYYFDADLAEKFGQCGENIAIVYNWFAQVLKARQVANNKITSVQVSARKLQEELPFFSRTTTWRAMRELVAQSYLLETPGVEGSKFSLGEGKTDKKPDAVSANWNVCKEGQVRHKKEGGDTKCTNTYNNTLKSELIICKRGYYTPASASFGGDSDFLSCAAARADKSYVGEKELMQAAQPLNIPANIVTESFLNTTQADNLLNLIIHSAPVLKNDYVTPVYRFTLLTDLLNNLISHTFENEKIKNYPISYVSKYLGKLNPINRAFEYSYFLPKTENTRRYADVILDCIYIFNSSGFAYELNQADVQAACNFLIRYPEVTNEAISAVFEFVCSMHREFHHTFEEKPIGESYCIGIQYANATLYLRAHNCVTLAYFFKHFGYFLYKAHQMLPMACLSELKPKRFNDAFYLSNPLSLEVITEILDCLQQVANEFGPLALRLDLCEAYRKHFITRYSQLTELRQNQTADEAQYWQLTDDVLHMPLTLAFYDWATKLVAKLNPQLLPDHMHAAI